MSQRSQAYLGAAFQQRWHPAAFKELLETQTGYIWLQVDEGIELKFKDDRDTGAEYFIPVSQ